MSLGQDRTGVTEQSLTVTVKLQLAVFPAASVAVQVTVVVPLANWDPEFGEQTTGTVPQLSVAWTLNETIAVCLPVSKHWVMFAGHVILGASQSWTTTTKLQ